MSVNKLGLNNKCLNIKIFKKISFLLLFGFVVLAFSLYTSQNSSAKVLIKFSHVVAAKGHPKGEAAEAFKNRVNSEMSGEVEIQVFPNSQLYNDDKVIEALLLGDVQMAAPSLSKFEKYTLQFRIFDLPFMFKDIEAVDSFQNSKVGQTLLTSMTSKGILGLAYWHNGLKQLSANRPLINPNDAKGLKFRIQTSDVLEAQFKALGANPQKLAFAEVYGALQQGVVDGQENTWSNIYTRKFFEVQDGITESNHGLLDYLVITSNSFWDKLEPNLRKKLHNILIEVTVEFNGKSNQINKDSKAKVIAAGSKVRQLNASQRAAWLSVMKPVWNQFSKDIGQDLINEALQHSK